MRLKRQWRVFSAYFRTYETPIQGHKKHMRLKRQSQRIVDASEVSAYVSICQHTSAYVSTRQHTSMRIVDASEVRIVDASEVCLYSTKYLRTHETNALLKKKGSNVGYYEDYIRYIGHIYSSII